MNIKKLLIIVSVFSLYTCISFASYAEWALDNSEPMVQYPSYPDRVHIPDKIDADFTSPLNTLEDDKVGFGIGDEIPSWFDPEASEGDLR